MIRFKTYLREMWKTDDLEDVDMSHGYHGYASLKHFPSSIETHDIYALRHAMLTAHVRDGGSWRDIDNPNHPSPHVQTYWQQRREYDRLGHESRQNPDDPSKNIKIMRHMYSYPTFTDVERIKSSAVDGMVSEFKDGSGLMHPVEHVLKNVHMFPGHHSGKITFVEHDQRPTEVFISEHGRHDRDPNEKTTAKSATNAYKYAVSALRHFTSLPEREWKNDHWTVGIHSEKDRLPHRITPRPSGVHIFMGSTPDARKDKFYDMITKQMGHIFINTTGVPRMTTRDERIFRRTGRAAPQ